MYPKNAASPPRFAIGPVVQISDGAVQTSGVSVKIMPQGGAASAGGGTIGYEEGVVHYLPTQAETNYSAFIAIAYKTGCLPASQTIVTSASPVAGHVGLDWSVINAPTTTVALTGTTIAATQKVDVDTIKTNPVVNAGTVTFPTGATLASTTNITAGTITTATGVTTVNGLAAGVITAASIAASALDGKGNWNVGKTGYSLTATTGLGNQTADITGSLSGSVGSVTGLTNATVADAVWDEAIAGHVGAGSTGAALNGATAPTAAAVADAVWDEALSGHLAAGSTGEALNAAGAAGDPWVTALPGAYGAGSAGYIVGTNLNATVSSRSTLDAAGVRTAVGLASANLDTQLTAIDDYLDTEVAAIKAKTDNLPAAPAAVSDIPTAIQNADALLARDLGSGSGAGTLDERTVRSALRFVRNKWSVAGGTLTVKKEDDTTTAWTSAVSTDAAAEPIIGVDPA